MALFADTFGADRLTRPCPVARRAVAALAAWETSRKIRAPEDETSYRTYSRVLGWKVAPFLPATFLQAPRACAARVADRRTGRRVSTRSCGGRGRWSFSVRTLRMAPTRRHANLKPWAILFATVANAGSPRRLRAPAWPGRWAVPFVHQRNVY